MADRWSARLDQPYKSGWDRVFRGCGQPGCDRDTYYVTADRGSEGYRGQATSLAAALSLVGITMGEGPDAEG